MSVVSMLELYAGVRNQAGRAENGATCVAGSLLLPVDAGHRQTRRYLSFGIYTGKSRHRDAVDAIIAATAEHHGLRLATLNVKHFPMFPKLKRAY